MGSYRPLFSVSVGHDYFSDGVWKGLEFVPVPAARKVIENADVLVKRTCGGIGVFYGEDRADALRLYAEEAGGALRFGFKVYAADRTFANYTVPYGRMDDAVLHFSGQRGADENGSVLLSKGDTVSEADFVGMEALMADGVLGERDRRMPPDFVVEVVVAPGKDASGKTIWPPLDGRLKFSARWSFWRYFLLGNMNKAGSMVVDLDNRVEFEQLGEVVLPGNRPARVFRSKELVPVLEKSAYRFQLREQGQGGSRVLVKRLPVASESRLGMDTINGKNEIVLDAYVNC